ncbi:hypothetical protein AB0E63_37665 [Kribbella sp. NPDC026596]|jgi:hypothetical protein|uniref:hypothetical protein n=1 Tax=Kribbella sp. NPDC026596 TaxID=3155122 RepID=UPI003405C6A3
MDADKSREPRVWADLEARMGWLPKEPYLLESGDLKATLRELDALGFRVVRTRAPEEGNLEEALLIELTERLGFAAGGAGSWAAFEDRLWDLQHAPGEPPIAVVIDGFDRFMRRSVHTFVRCIHNLVSMTEAVGLSDERADLQIEYFFVGDWNG